MTQHYHLRINRSDVPSYAFPDQDWPPVFRWPEPQATYSTGKPTKAVGFCRAEFGRSLIGQAGLNYWMASFIEQGGASVLSINASVELLDPLSDTWLTASGHLWRPTYDYQSFAGCQYRNFHVILEGLEFVTITA